MTRPQNNDNVLNMNEYANDSYGTGEAPLVNRELTLTKVILIANVIVFLVMMVLGDPSDAEFMYGHGALWTPSVLQDHEYYRLFTAMFLHFDFEHILSNLVLLFFMGDILEKALGKVRFFVVYIVSGIVGNVITMFLESQNADYAVSAGASGAIFGVLGGILFEVLLCKGHFAYITTGRMVFFILFSLYVGFSDSSINNAAHIGGLIGGFICTAVVYYLTMKKKRIGRGF